MTKKEQLKLKISELIGELKGKRLSINGKAGQVIIDADSLIAWLKVILKEI